MPNATRTQPSINPRIRHNLEKIIETTPNTKIANINYLRVKKIEFEAHRGVDRGGVSNGSAGLNEWLVRTLPEAWGGARAEGWGVTAREGRLTGRGCAQRGLCEARGGLGRC